MKRLVLLLALLLAACGQPGNEAQRLLDDLASDGGATPLKATSPPVRLETNVSGDLYLTGAAPATRLLLLARYGRPLSEARIAGLAQSLARMRFEVLVPPDKGMLLPGADAADQIAETIAKFADGRKIAIVAFSASFAPALYAAAKHPDLVSGVAEIGAFADPKEAWSNAWTTSPRQGWVILGGIAERIAQPRDRILLANAIARKSADPFAAIDDFKSQMSDAGRSILQMGEDSTHDVPDEITAPLIVSPGHRPWPILLINGTDDALAPSPDALAALLQVPRENAIALQTVTHFGDLSFRDRRAWLRAISVLLGWRE